MKTYSDQTVDTTDPKFPWTQFRIIAKTENDRQELMKAFKYFHDSQCTDTEYIVVNQLVHLYQDEPRDPCNIIVAPDLFPE